LASLTQTPPAPFRLAGVLSSIDFTEEGGGRSVRLLSSCSTKINRRKETLNDLENHPLPRTRGNVGSRS
jgi:hypothetical protein